MALTFTCLSDVYTADADDVIDVRSPAEFAEDHIPGAVSLPVLSNEERAEVGTIYVQEAPFKARKVGAALVARNAAAHIEGPLAAKDGAWRPLIYCWRGGQRSGSFASILSQIGWRADTVAGGYQSYRRLVVDYLHEAELPHRIVLLDGNTGTAKTELLGLLAARGVQVVDLEALAAHRGIAIWRRGSVPQPAQKGFESALAQALVGIDPEQPVVIEAESSKVGEILVPPSLWKAMRDAPRIRIEAPVEARAGYLARTYRDVISDPRRLSATLDKLVQFQGYARVAAWKELAAEGDYVQLAAELVEHHYDQRYAKSRSARDGDPLQVVNAEDLSPDALARAADAMAAKLPAL